MNIKAIRSDAIYRRMAGASKEEKDNIYRYELMEPFVLKAAVMLSLQAL